jgi:succinate dehydrogenase/fumarate reductase-like Fe-S protein
MSPDSSPNSPSTPAASAGAAHAPRGPLTARLTVWRGVAPGPGHFQTYEVPFEPGQSVLDGLRWVRAHQDSSLAVRFACINANACKECMLRVNGKTVYACTTRLEAGEQRLEPLPNKAWVRDVVSEITPPDERLARAAAGTEDEDGSELGSGD